MEKILACSLIQLRAGVQLSSYSTTLYKKKTLQGRQKWGRLSRPLFSRTVTFTRMISQKSRKIVSILYCLRKKSTCLHGTVICERLKVTLLAVQGHTACLILSSFYALAPAFLIVLNNIATPTNFTRNIIQNDWSHTYLNTAMAVVKSLP